MSFGNYVTLQTNDREYEADSSTRLQPYVSLVEQGLSFPMMTTRHRKEMNGSSFWVAVEMLDNLRYR